MSLSRRDTNWDEHFKVMMFPEKEEQVRGSRAPENQKTCTICGDFCAMERGVSLFSDDIKGDKIT